MKEILLNKSQIDFSYTKYSLNNQAEIRKSSTKSGVKNKYRPFDSVNTCHKNYTLIECNKMSLKLHYSC